MIRHAAQTFKHLVLTVLLLIGGVCALEVGLRIRRATQGAATATETADLLAATTAPSRSTWLSVAPRLRFTRIESESGRPFTLRTNSFGLRNPEIEIPRPAGTFRILCLGDDCTFGGDQPESLTYVRRLADLIQSQTSTRVEVLNAGCPGGCPTVSALLLRHRMMNLQPDVIVLHVDPSDIADEEALRRHVERNAEGFPLSAMHPATAGRTNLAAQLDDELLVVRAMRDEVKDLWSRGQSGGGVQNSRRADLQVCSDAFVSIRAALAAIQRLAEAQSVEFLVATAAEPAGRNRNQKSPGRAPQWPPQELRSICDELGLTLIDATADLEAELADSSRPRRGGGFSPEAHQIYAEILGESLLNRFTAEPAAVQTPKQVSERTEIR